MTETNRPFWRPSVVIAILLSWLGLAGLADAFVEWKLWFEFGVMNHWRALQAWVLQYVPFSVPFWVLDYLMLGAIYNRSLLLAISRNFAKEHQGPSSAPKTRRGKVVEAILIGLFSLLIGLVLWPLSLVSLCCMALWPNSFEIIFGGDSNSSTTQRSIDGLLAKDALRNLIFSIATFIPVLFVLTNEIAPALSLHLTK